MCCAVQYYYRLSPILKRVGALEDFVVGRQESRMITAKKQNKLEARKLGNLRLCVE